jgi:prephenate dehydrogenase
MTSTQKKIRVAIAGLGAIGKSLATKFAAGVVS